MAKDAISINTLYDLYLDTVARCARSLIRETDEVIGYNLFEEFASGAVTFLHEDNLAKLQGAGYINDEMLDLSKQVREKWLALQSQDWSFEEIRTRQEWQSVFAICDRILFLSRARNGIEED